MLWDSVAAAAAPKSLQSCPTLCDAIDGSPPGSPVPGILQARTLEWVAISFSNSWKWRVKGKSLSRGRLLATPWTAAYQAPPSMGFSRQELLEWGAIAFSNIYLAHCNLKCREMQCFVSLWETSLEKCEQWLLSSHGIADNRIWASLLCFVNCHPKFGSASHIGSFILSVSWNSLKVLWVWSFGPASPPLGLLHF